MAHAFIIRPFNTKKDSSGKELDFKLVHESLIEPALQEAELDGITTGEIVEAGNIREDMFSLILESDVVICDITIHNANVFYELGIRHALRKKRTILIKGEPVKDRTPFDLSTDRYLSYDIHNPSLAKDKLVETIKSTLKNDNETDSPLFKMLPTLQEANQFQLQAVPVDFREELERAQVAKEKGWLRLLSDEVQSRRFQWGGLRLVATAQWQIKDYEGARKSWEKLREMYPNDIDANLALANIYERQSRSGKNVELLEKSNHAIKRVVNNGDATGKQRVEALALEGRNQKTRWRWGFKDLETLEERREIAMNRALLNSYEAYLNAFNQDLNHCYSGLTALQMGMIFLMLSERDDSWKTVFEDDRCAEECRCKLERNIGHLQEVVSFSIEAELHRLNQDDPDRVWAQISKADLLFLTSDSEKRVVNAYQEAVPRDNLFAWDSAKGQLQLFSSLGIKEELVDTVINRITTPETEGDMPVHIILFAGHRIDTSNRETPRFPADREDHARELIRSKLESLKEDDTRLFGLASATPGADMLFHEVCAELDIPSKLCLPMPADVFASHAFEDLDDWRSRFLNFKKDDNILELSDCEGLPKWLHDTGGDPGVDPWERGNCWVLQMALASDAKKITLVTLWDNNDQGDALGGTAHMVQIARDAGNIHIEAIDAKELLSQAVDA